MGNFDILFLCHEKDIKDLKENIKYARKNIVGYRKIFVLSKENYFPDDKDIGFIDEKIFPFNKEVIGKYAPKRRAAWYYQQFLKLYTLKVVGEEVLDNLLIADADLRFIKKTAFFNKGVPLYNFEIGYHQPYYKIMEKVLGFGKQNLNISATVHHMVYQRKYINNLLNFTIKKDGKEFWKDIMENISKDTISGFSEQETYFNFMMKFYPNKIKVRRLRFIDFPYNGSFWVKFFGFFGYSYIASHHYLKENRFSVIKCLGIEFLKLIGLKILIKRMIIRLKMAGVK